MGRPQIGLATEAAWCAADQDGFFDYQHALYEEPEAMSDQSDLTDLASSIGLDGNEFSECLSSGTHRADLERARQAAIEQGVNSTPTFLVNDQRIEGNQPYEVFQVMIELELAKGQ